MHALHERPRHNLMVSPDILTLKSWTCRYQLFALQEIWSVARNIGKGVAFPVTKIVTLRSLSSKNLSTCDRICQNRLLSYLHLTVQSPVNSPSFH